MYQCSMKQFTIIAVVNAPFLDNVWLEMSSGCFSGRLRYEDCCQGICEQNWQECTLGMGSAPAESGGLVLEVREIDICSQESNRVAYLLYVSK